MRGIHQGLVDSPHKGPVMCQAFPCHDNDDIITLMENPDSNPEKNSFHLEPNHNAHGELAYFPAGSVFLCPWTLVLAAHCSYWLPWVADYYESAAFICGFRIFPLVMTPGHGNCSATRNATSRRWGWDKKWPPFFQTTMNFLEWKYTNLK